MTSPTWRVKASTESRTRDDRSGDWACKFSESPGIARESARLVEQFCLDRSSPEAVSRLAGNVTQTLSVEPLTSGIEFHLKPGIEHCLIGTEDLLVFERSIDPKGMDQDLIFIYEPGEN